jgi:hypothetical protein
MTSAALHTLAATATGRPIPTPPTADPVEWAAFVADVVVIPGGCHLWLGELFGAGYGKVTVAAPPATLFGPPRRMVTGAHRYTYTVFHGPLDDDVQVRHCCDEPLCTPVTAAALDDHLTVGDAYDNACDREHRGRGGRRRHGVRRHGADTRPRLRRSLELQHALRTAIGCGMREVELVDVVEQVYAAGAPHRDQLVLPVQMGPPRLRLVR